MTLFLPLFMWFLCFVAGVAIALLLHASFWLCFLITFVCGFVGARAALALYEILRARAL